MMVLSALRPDAGIFEFLANRARSASVRRLATDVAIGVTVFGAVIRWTFAAELVVASAATVLFAYGAWGLLDRAASRLANRPWPRITGLFEALGALSVALGVVGVAGALLAVWALALGTWIS